MKRWIVVGEIVIIGILITLLFLDFTGIGRKNRKQLSAIDHVSGNGTPGAEVITPMSEDPIVYHKEGDVLVPPSPTPTPTPTPLPPTPTLSPEEQIIQDGINKAYAISIPGGIAFANVSDYLSIRREPDGTSARLGLMNPGDSCIVESVNGDWAYVKSGAVKGYCRADLLIRGLEGEEYAKEHVVYIATVLSPVNVRSEPTTQEDNIISSLDAGAIVTAKTPALRSKGDETTPLFIEVELKDGRTGYIASNKADITYMWPVGHAIDDTKEQK
ncbi:MAG: SH3 domain-containing protein [Lachnospiraceae bacterium]|nr:SH3 domain-containing protein [Lachnospiraceae bacterium]